MLNGSVKPNFLFLSMLTQKEILRRLREQKSELQHKFPVKNLALFALMPIMNKLLIARLMY